MSERLLSVGLDVGTTTTQLILSELTVENRASGFAVPHMQITDRRIRYESPVHFTPLLDEAHVDGPAIRALVKEDYARAGITAGQVDTGAVIITGETSRKENARTVLESLAGYAGEFVVATAGPDLESVLAAKGAGATDYSAKTGKTVLHMDIGGGTSNLALIEDGRITKTGCLNVGGRLLKFDSAGRVYYVSPVLNGLTDLRPGDYPAEGQVEALAQILTHALEMAAGLRSRTELLDRLATAEAGQAFCHAGAEVISFSGGVADCITKQHPPRRFEDMGPALGQAIHRSRLCQNTYTLGSQTIRATVIGAGCHSTQLSGSTVFFRGVRFPLKNLPVVALSAREQEDPAAIAEKLWQQDADRVILAMPGYRAPTHTQITALARTVSEATAGRPLFLCLENDMAKALGHSLCLQLPEDVPCLCIDRLGLEEGSFLDVGAPVGPALPVVIKTLVLPTNN